MIIQRCKNFGRNLFNLFIIDFIITKLRPFLDVPLYKRDNLLPIWRPLFRTLFGIIILTLIICFIIPYFVKLEPGEDWQFEKQELFVSMLIILSNILVSYNTFMFIKDADGILTNYVPNIHEPNGEGEEIQRLQRYNSIFKRCNFVTFGLSTFIVVFYLLKVTNIKDFSFEKLFVFNEVGSIFIFLFFCIADRYMLRELDIAIKSNSSSVKLKALKKFTLSAFPLIDIVGFLGVAIIGIISLFIHSHIHDHFVEGFAIGALAFHIIFTQINFAYLKTVELRDETVIT